MTCKTSEAPFGSGGRNRDFPALADVWSQGKLAARASTTYMIKPMSEVTPKGAGPST